MATFVHWWVRVYKDAKIKDILCLLGYNKSNNNLSKYFQPECCHKCLLPIKKSPVDDVPQPQSVVPVVEVGDILHTSLCDVLRQAEGAVGH